jgi:hypothetical protein
MVGGLDAGESVTIPGTSIVVEVCALASEATFDFAKVSVYDTGLGQSSTCNVALNPQTPQTPQTPQMPKQPQPQCKRRQIGDKCRRPGQCCSDNCAGTGWHRKCLA